MERDQFTLVRGRRRRRWIVPLLLSLPLAVVVIGLGACLPVPLGDPETSRIDPRLAGVWANADKEGSMDVCVLVPFDGRAYLLRTEEVRQDEEGAVEVKHLGEYKAWLTTIKERIFITLQPLYLPAALDSPEDTPGHIVARLSISEDGNRVDARGIDPNFPALAPLRMLPGHMEYEPPEGDPESVKPPSEKEARALLRRVIEENVDNEALYVGGAEGEVTYVRVTDKAILKALFEDVLGD